VTQGPLACHLLVDRAVTHHRSRTTRGEIRAFARCRNERLRLPAFLRHYRDLGVDRFFVIDNDSSDGSTEYLADEPDVHLLRTSNRYSEAKGGTAWLNALLAEFGVGCWCVTVDIDELIVFPGSEQATLHTLTAYLERDGFEALVCLLLDLYPAGPLDECPYVAGGDLLAAAPYFDAGPYEKARFDTCPGFLVLGGMRERVFHSDLRTRGLVPKIYANLFNHVVLRTPFLRDRSWIRAHPPPSSPCLTKVPLVRWDDTSMYLKSNHGVSPKVVAPVSGVLLHFKFLHDFHARAVREAARGEYYNQASEYRTYAERLDRDPHMTFMYDGSIRFGGTNQLVRLGLMDDNGAWADARTKR
jgi:hypothetical protein